MSATVGLPSNVVIRDLLLTLWFSRRRILLIMLAAMALAAYVAFQVEPKYQSRASFLVLLGSEYGMRPVGGQQLMSNINAVPEELLHTEADILSSDDLHRDVIEQIGVARLYPDLLKPPGLFARLVKQARSSVYDLLGLQDGEEIDSAAAELSFRYIESLSGGCHRIGLKLLLPGELRKGNKGLLDVSECR